MTNADANGYRIWREVDLLDRADEMPWVIGQTIALVDGKWVEAKGDERIRADIMDVLT